MWPTTMVAVGLAALALGCVAGADDVDGPGAPAEGAPVADPESPPSAPVAEIPGVRWTPLADLGGCVLERAENPGRVDPLVFGDCQPNPGGFSGSCRELLSPTTGTRRFLRADGPPPPFADADPPVFFVPAVQLAGSSLLAVADPIRERTVAVFRGCADVDWTARDGRAVAYHDGVFGVIDRTARAVDVYRLPDAPPWTPGFDVSDEGLAWVTDHRWGFEPRDGGPPARHTFSGVRVGAPLELVGRSVIAVGRRSADPFAPALVVRLEPNGDEHDLVRATGRSITLLRSFGDGRRALFADLSLEDWPLRLLVTDETGSTGVQSRVVTSRRTAGAVRGPETTLWVNGYRVAIVTGVDRPRWLRLDVGYGQPAPASSPWSDDDPSREDRRGPRYGTPLFRGDTVLTAPIGSSPLPAPEVWLARIGDATTVVTFQR